MLFGTGRNGQFQLTPHNVTFYFDTSRYMQQLCIPPDIIPRPEVRWKKGNQTLTNGKRVLMLASEELKSFDTKVHVKNGSRVFLLSINPVGETDQGIYHCVFNSTNGEESASFSVKITDSCKPGTFKCRVDKKCILASALCDGVVHCSDSSDERDQCSPPLIPFGLRKHSKTWKQITIVWETVAGKITGYELLVIYPNNLNKTFIPSHPLVTIHGLAASTRYGFAVRSKSHAGYSEYSKIVYVSTRAHGLPKIPQGLRCTQKDVDFITIAWNNVKDASSYDLEMFTPDRNATEYFIAFRRLPQITVKGLTNNTLYRFKVRARSTFGTGNFSEAIVARTLPIGKPGAPTKIAAVVSGFDVSITWHHPNYRKNSQIFHLYYMITLCILEPVTAIVLVNKTVTVTVQPISFQQEGNSSVKVSAQQHITAGGVEKNNVTVQTRRELLMYKERECVKSKKLGYTRSIFTKLNPATTYRYTVTTFGRNDIEGGSVTGNFTIAMFTTLPPTHNPLPKEEFSGILVFAIVSGFLIILLVIAFAFAYFCKWKLLMDAVEEHYLSKQNNAKNTPLKGSSTNPEVIIDSYDKL